MARQKPVKNSSQGITNAFLNGTNGFTFVGGVGGNTYQIDGVIAVADINHDGYADIIVSNGIWNDFVLFGPAGGWPSI